MLSRRGQQALLEYGVRTAAGGTNGREAVQGSLQEEEGATAGA